MSIKASAKSSGARRPSSSSMADSTTGGRARRCEVMCVSIYRGTASGGQIDKGFSGLRERANEGGRRKRSEKQISGQRFWENKKNKIAKGARSFCVHIHFSAKSKTWRARLSGFCGQGPREALGRGASRRERLKNAFGHRCQAGEPRRRRRK